MIKSITAVLCMMVISLPLLAQERETPRGKIIIFQFRDTSKTTDYSYYTYIIPDSIALELRRKDMYAVHTYPVTLDYVSERDPADKKKEHILYLSGRGREFGADFIISGMYRVENNRINIKGQLFNVREQKILGIDETSDEMGALVFLIIDNLTERINTQLRTRETAGKAEKKEKAEEGPPAKSPFLPLYNALRGTVFGAEHGKLHLLGDWGSIYNDTENYAFHIRYGLGALGSRNSSVALNYHYLSAQPDNFSSSLMIWGASLGYVYSYPVFGRFRITAEGSLGMTSSTLRIYDPLGMNSGPQPPMEEKESLDPFTRLLFTAGYDLEPLVISTGFSMNRIWYSDEPMDFVSLIFSLGFRI